MGPLEALSPVEEARVSGNTYLVPVLGMYDEGDYRCVAVNKGGNATKDIRVDVRVAPTVAISGETGGVEKQPVEVSCIARGDPKPTVKWVKVDGDERDSGIKQAETSKVEGGITEVVRQLAFTELSSEVCCFYLMVKPSKNMHSLPQLYFYAVSPFVLNHVKNLIFA